MRRLALAAASLLVLSTCGDSTAATTETTLPIEFPSVVVDGWLDALVAEDYATANAAVEPIGLAVILAVENNWSVEETAALIDAGLPGPLVAGYWSSFREGFGSFSARPLDAIEVGRHTDVVVDDTAYAAVDISTDNGSSVVMTRRSRNGAWQIDVVGTVGPAFVVLLREHAGLIDDDDASQRVLEAYETVVLPSLRAVAQVDESDRSLAADVARLEAVLREVG